MPDTAEILADKSNTDVSNNQQNALNTNNESLEDNPPKKMTNKEYIDKMDKDFRDHVITMETEKLDSKIADKRRNIIINEEDWRNFGNDFLVTKKLISNETVTDDKKNLMLDEYDKWCQRALEIQQNLEYHDQNCIERSDKIKGLKYSQSQLESKLKTITKELSKRKYNKPGKELERLGLANAQHETRNLISKYKADISDNEDMLKLSEEYRREKTADFNNIMGIHCMSEYYTEYLNYHNKKSKLDKELTQLTNDKNNIRADVMGADLTSLNVRKIEGEEKERTTKGLYVNGTFYHSQDADNKITTDKLYDTEIRRAVEKQKVINAIRSREIFKQVNKDCIVECLSYDDKTGEFNANNNNNQDVPPIEEFTDFQLMLQGLLGGLKNVGKFTLKSGLGFLASYTGVEKFMQIGKSKSTNDKAASASTAFNVATGSLTSMSVGSFGLDCLDSLTNVQDKAGLVIKHLNNWRSTTGSAAYWNIGWFNILADSSLSVAGGLSYLLTMISDGITAYASAKDKNQLAQAEDIQGKQGNKGYSRILGNAKIEKKILEVNSYIDIVKTALSTTFALTGLGGLLAPAISIGGGMLAQLIAGGILSKKRKKEVLYSHDILGGIEYDSNSVNEDMFNDILYKETGIKDTDGLYDAIRITDSINLHRNVRKSVARNAVDRDTDMTMTALGYSDTSKYPKIKLEDIQKKMGYTDDWHKGLHNAIEKRGIDYDTSFSTFVRGLRGRNFYVEKDASRMYSEGLISKEEYDKIIESTKRQAENKALGANLVPEGAT